MNSRSFGESSYSVLYGYKLHTKRLQEVQKTLTVLKENWKALPVKKAKITAARL